MDTKLKLAISLSFFLLLVYIHTHTYIQACATFWNGYGPTEATVYTTTYLIPKDRLLDAVPIGTALPGMYVYIRTYIYTSSSSSHV